MLVRLSSDGVGATDGSGVWSINGSGTGIGSGTGSMEGSKITADSTRSEMLVRLSSDGVGATDGSGTASIEASRLTADSTRSEILVRPSSDGVGSGPGGSNIPCEDPIVLPTSSDILTPSFPSVSEGTLSANSTAFSSEGPLASGVMPSVAFPPSIPKISRILPAGAGTGPSSVKMTLSSCFAASISFVSSKPLL